jgi:hypothetical protein
VVLRLGLGEDAKATEDAALYLKTYGATRPLQAAAMTLALATHHVEREEWERARAVLTRSAAALDRGSLDVRVQALALSARIHLHDHAPARARDDYARVRALWSAPRAAEASLRSARPGEPEGAANRRVGLALNAVGEATFVAAEERRVAEVQVLKVPAYAGARDRASVLAHVQTKVRPWFEAKQRAIEGVELALAAILDIKPMPPPKWVIHAAATVAFMWGDFADELRRVPIPEAWQKDRALYAAYYAAADDMIGALKSARARPAARKCVDLGAKLWFFDPKTRACEAWLAANDPSFHPIDELTPPLRSGPRFAEARPFASGEAPEGP